MTPEQMLKAAAAPAAPAAPLLVGTERTVKVLRIHDGEPRQLPDAFNALDKSPRFERIMDVLDLKGNARTVSVRGTKKEWDCFTGHTVTATYAVAHSGQGTKWYFGPVAASGESIADPDAF